MSVTLSVLCCLSYVSSYQSVDLIIYICVLTEAYANKEIICLKIKQWKKRCIRQNRFICLGFAPLLKSVSLDLLPNAVFCHYFLHAVFFFFIYIYSHTFLL